MTEAADRFKPAERTAYGIFFDWVLWGQLFYGTKAKRDAVSEMKRLRKAYPNWIWSVRPLHLVPGKAIDA